MKCKDCEHLRKSMAPHRGCSSIYSCGLVRGECTPYKEISRIRGPEEIPTKTAPRWCPLKKVIRKNKDL